MSTGDRVAIRKLPTGVPGLDKILGGGLPEYSFNIIAGAPGAGKTTLAQQVLFANATPERPGLYFTVLALPKCLLAYSRVRASHMTNFGRDLLDIHKSYLIKVSL